jgi:LmbE family N-acetylglucosaminyl deacetylase
MKYETINQKPSLNPKVVLGIAAHPDDLDFGASGSFASWAKTGTDVYYLVLTDGSIGSPDLKMSSPELVKLRQTEQKNAAKILGAKEVFFLGYEDGALQNTMDLKRDIVRVIRQVKPEVAITMDPTFVYSVNFGFINHPDHRAAGQAALDAIFPLARDHLSFPELYAEGYKPHKVETVLLNHFEDYNFVVDITNSIDLKMQALAAHISQMPDIKSTQNRMRQTAKNTGAKAGYEYGEGFVRIDISA